MTKNNLKLITSSLSYFESAFASDFINNFNEIETSMKRAIISHTNDENRKLSPYIPGKSIMKQRSRNHKELRRG